MSHFTKLEKAQVVDPHAFGKAMADIGFTGELKENVTLPGYMGNKTKADFAVMTGKYGVGLVKNATGKYDMVADWWGVRGELTEKGRAEMGRNNDGALQDAVLRHTTKHTIVTQYRRQGFMARVTSDNDNNMTVTLTR